LFASAQAVVPLNSSPGGRCGGYGYFTPNGSSRNELICTRKDTFLAGPAEVSHQAEHLKKKRAKSPPKRADRIWRDLLRGESPLNFRLNPVRPAPDPALTVKQKPNQVPPSLGAKYRGLLKSCQEKTTGLPQNMEYQLSKASIRSGVCAELGMDLR